MENLFIDESIVFEDKNIVVFLDNLRDMKRIHRFNMVEFCKSLVDLKRCFSCSCDEKYCSSHLVWALQTDINGNRYNYYEFCEKVLNLEKSYITRLCRVYDKFLSCDSCDVATIECFSISKLIELLPLSLDEFFELEYSRRLSPKMSVKQIRELVKSIKGKTSEDEESEEDIPLAFDPKQVYEFQYFDGLSKNQLVNIAMSYQSYIHKGKNG